MALGLHVGCAELDVSNNHLSTYLNDHLAGSVAAIDLLRRLETWYGDDRSASIVRSLTDEIAADQQELEILMDNAGIARSVVRQVTGWMSERVIAAKLAADDPTAGAFRILESLEILSLGIHGKLGLWNALGQTVGTGHPLAGTNFDRLRARAMAQREVVEQLRLKAAHQALTDVRSGAQV